MFPLQISVRALTIVSSSQSFDMAIVGLDQHFENVEHFKDGLHNFAIKQNFDFTFLKVINHF